MIKTYRNKLYQHYKGAAYEVLYEGVHTETEEDMVVYTDLKDNIWIRPSEMFYGDVELEDGKTVKRFEFIAEIDTSPMRIEDMIKTK